MNSTFVEGADGKPYVVHHEHVGLGIAVDVEKSDGSRTLLVPVHQGRRHARLPRRSGRPTRTSSARSATTSSRPTTSPASRVTLTNPGTIGTRPVRAPPHAGPGPDRRRRARSTTRPRSRAPTPRRSPTSACRRSSRSRSTYDHRIIQGAESGLFLKRVHELLHRRRRLLRRRLPRRSACPTRPSQWRRDVNPVDREQSMLEKQMQVDSLINMYRVRGHLIADLDPLPAEEPADAPRARPRHLRADHLGPRPRVPHRRRRRAASACRSATSSHVLRDAYCRTIGIEYMHIQEPDEKHWIQEQVEGVPARARPRTSSATSSSRLNAAEALEQFLATKYIGQKRFGIDGAESAIPILDAILAEAADAHIDSAVHRHGPPRPAQRARQHRRQELRAAVQGVRGQHRPRLHPGLGRREVPPRPDRQVRQPRRQRDPGRAGRQPVAPRSASTRVVVGMARAQWTRSSRPATTRCCRS